MIDSVLMFSRSIPHHQPGGMETLAWNLAAEWARTVPSVSLVTTAVPAFPGPFTEDGITVVPLAGTQPGRYSTAWWDRSREYWNSLAVAPSAVLSVSAGAYAAVRDRGRFPATPFLLQAHGTSVMEIGSKLRTPSLRSLAGSARNALAMTRDLARYKDFDRIVAVGEKVVDSLTAAPYRVAPSRISLVPNGVRVEDHGFDPHSRKEIRAALGIDDDVTVVGCIGRLHVQKRVDRALHAAAVLRDRGEAGGFRFLIVGDGPDERRLRGLADELRLGGLVQFVGRVASADVRGYYSASDVSLLTTSRLEGLPMAVLEALSSGLRVVVPAGAVGAAQLRDYLSEVDPSDAAATATAVTRAGSAGSPAFLQSSSRASLLPPEFTMEHCARSYLAAFDHAVEELRRG